MRRSQELWTDPPSTIVVETNAEKPPQVADIRPRWASLSPGGDLLMIHYGKAVIFHVAEDHRAVASDMPLPRLNYEQTDPDNRWFFSNWAWLSDTEVISALGIPTRRGHMLVGSHLYHYDIQKQRLSEVLLPENFIGDNNPRGLIIRAVSGRRVRLGSGLDEIWVKIPEQN